MNIIRTAIPDVLLLEPRVFADSRGYFFEAFHARRWEAETGVAAAFVQDNQSRSTAGVLRGLHYQVRQAQGKLLRVVAGEIYDVAVRYPAVVADVPAVRGADPECGGQADDLDSPGVCPRLPDALGDGGRALQDDGLLCPGL